MENKVYFSLEEIVDHARKHSPFYKELYKNLPEQGWNLENLPVIDSKKFWLANVSGKDNKVITNINSGGIVFKSGGTTGAPKHSCYSREEWRTMCQDLGQHFKSVGLKDGDRVANLFYGGSLYASFLFVYHSLMEAPVDTMQFPLSGSAAPELVIETIKEFNINVLMGIPTTILKFINHIAQHENSIKIDRIFYAGETMFPDQRNIIKRIFPDIEIYTCGLATVDAGFLAWADNTCGFNEHRVLEKHTIIEIIDPKTYEPIVKEGQEGIIIATNLTRKLMPIIRYPIGDYGMWCEPENTIHRKFVLLGRSDLGARVGPATVYVSDIERIIKKFSNIVEIENFQLIVKHENNLDKLIINLVVREKSSNLNEVAEKFIKTLLNERKMLADLINENLIHPVDVKWINSSELIINKRTGKCMRVVDNRINMELQKL